jgi:Phytanoyl-CoA dioxygenase (PhyH)
MALASLDRRTRFDADLRLVTPETFFNEELPALVDRHGAMVAAGMAALDAPPLALRVDGRAWTFVAEDGSLAVRDGVVDGALVVALDEVGFSDWAQLQRSFNGMVVMQELVFDGGEGRDVSVWDALWHTLLEGWPVVADDLRFLDRQGEPLDLGQSFTVDDDPDDIAHFLREAGYLHLRGWLDLADMATIAEDIDRAVPSYAEGDGKSWWAVLADGTRRCVRLQEFLEHSPTTADILTGARWNQLRQTLAGDDDLVDGSSLEALIKPVGVVQGASDVTFHRDCHLGRHPYGCSGTTVGISVTGSDETNGRLRVAAGSHRVAMPVLIAQTEPYLPVVAMSTEPGDLTVHLSCTLHEADPPKVAERKVMYTGFSLAPRPGDGGERSRQLSEQREQIPDLLLSESGQAV